MKSRVTSSNMSTSSSSSSKISKSNSSTSTTQQSNLQSPVSKKKTIMMKSQTRLKSSSSPLINTNISSKSGPFIPHRGNLRRIHNQNGPSSTSFLYSLSIQLEKSKSLSSNSGSREFELLFSRTHYEHIHRLFCIMDTESRGLLRRSQVSEFVDLRCPVFRRRDGAIQRSLVNHQNHCDFKNTSHGDESTSSSTVKPDVSSSGGKSAANVAIHNMAAKMNLATSSGGKQNHHPKLPHMPNFGNLISFPGVSNLNKNINNPRRNKDSSSSSTICNSNCEYSIPRWNSTFDEVWNTVVTSASSLDADMNPSVIADAELSLEGWMLFCRLIALAQYQEAKSRFSVKHLQQNSEIIMVELPPPIPPSPLNLQALFEQERGKFKRDNSIKQTYSELSSAVNEIPIVTSLPLPELDLNHCLIAAHDNPYTLSTSSSSSLPPSIAPITNSKTKTQTSNVITVTLFGAPNSSDNKQSPTSLSLASSPEALTSESLLHTGEMEFVVTTIDALAISNNTTSTNRARTRARVKVKRTMQDMQWLRETFATHQRLGGTLCGRILPPFPTQERKKGGVFMAVNSLRSLTSWGKSKDRKWESGEGVKKAKELERCLNYLMEHPALRTSFPLNAILKASQSGLDAAKRLLENEEMSSINTNSNTTSNTSTPLMDTKTKFDLSNFFSNFTEPQNPNLAWIRTAAQAAMALKVHGILDATGCASASARLQHASLPSFDTSKWWRGDYNTHNNHHSSYKKNKQGDHSTNDDLDKKNEDQCFENGVVSIESELEADEGYDLLPSPTQTPSSTNSTPSQSNTSWDSPPKKFHYGKENSPSVDNDIHKLYEIINAMENTLTRCKLSSRSIADARRERNSLHVQIVKGLDSWEGLRGEIVCERALMEGVVGLEGVRNLVEDSDYSISDSLSWQSSLAMSAVSAAETVRSAVRAARTALSAKTAAESAALAAQKYCASSFPSPEEARAAQTRASISHSHAIHAAVVEHEAFGAKRRAAMALAHDVNCWNEHRKREMIQTLHKCAQSQKEAARASRIAWVGLREGMYGVTSYCDRMSEQNGELLLRDLDLNVNSGMNNDWKQYSNDGFRMTKIVPVDHKSLGPSPTRPLSPHSHDSSYLNSNISLSPSRIPFPNLNQTKRDRMSPSSILSDPSDISERLASSESTDENDVMTASMQSLVDGLMTWGGRYDPQDDMSLPSGMAVSIALEESGVLSSQENVGEKSEKLKAERLVTSS